MEYLQKKKESVKSEEEAKEYEVLVASLSKLTGLRLDNAQDRYKYGLEATLPELVEVGLDQYVSFFLFLFFLCKKILTSSFYYIITIIALE